jgi:hypothetical protein
VRSSAVKKAVTHRERESLREAFRPKQIRLLFVGEAPPASGRFFYSQNSGLYRAMREAFQRVDPRVNDENFLRIFQASGCYLTDLSPEPIDQLEPGPRRHARISGEALLAKKIVELRPKKIAPLLRAIASHVSRAAALANWRGELIQLPYPGRWSHHRAEFVKLLRPALRELLADSRKKERRSF